MTTKPPTIPLPVPAAKPSKTLQTSVSNSTINPVVITTQFQSAKTRAASEPREKNNKPSVSPPVPPKRSTPTPPLIPPVEPIVNGHKKKTTPPGTVTHPPRVPSPDKSKVTVNKPSATSIFVPPPTLPTASNVRIDANIEIGRLEMEDVAEKDSSKVYESYVDDLIEEVIQSDFEKPSIPEVILAVITDLTNDDDHPERPLPAAISASTNLTQIYNFNQDKPRSTSPMPYPNTNGTNGDIEQYYTRVHQTVTNNNGINNQDSVRSTTSSNQSIAVPTVPEPTSNYGQVGFGVCLRNV